MYRRIGGAVVWIVCIAVSVAADTSDWVEMLSPEERTSLAAQGYLERLLDNRRDLRSLPDNMLENRIRQVADDVKPNILSERLIVLPATADRDDVLAMLNLFYQPENLAYLRYYNPLKGRSHDLFQECYIVSDPESREPRVISAAASVPEDRTIWMVQGLPPFGDVLQVMHFARYEAGFYFDSTNLDPLIYHDITFVRPEDMFTIVVMAPYEDGTVIYAVAGARVRPLFALIGGERMENSFVSRNQRLFSYVNDEILSRIGVD